MRAEPDLSPHESSARRWCLPAVLAAGIAGLLLTADAATKTSATYDEVTYLRVAARWWRTGEQAEITRMGSPLTFWKLQQAPTFWLLDRLGRSDLIDSPIERQAELLPIVRLGALWVWVVGLGVVAWWGRRLYGPRAMAAAAWLFVLSPNVLAHGSLVTMELPLLAASAGAIALFWKSRESGAPWPFWASAAVAGLAFSCKFTAVLLPPLLGLAWWIELVLMGKASPAGATWRVGRGMAGYVLVMIVADVIVTAGATLPLSPTKGQGHPSFDGRFGPAAGQFMTRLVETPIPQDWVGFATQLRHQRGGGSSYLLGERRAYGWWYYYLVALAVKVPTGFWLLLAARVARSRSEIMTGRDAMIPVLVLAFLGLTALGSSRNYGLRYLLPMAPPAVVWVSALADRGRWARGIVAVGLLGQALAVASIHPHELTYFNSLGGGPAGGRHVLADSNLDWGQGLLDLARLQRDRPEFRDLTLYYFGDTHPRHYGVVGNCHVIDAGAVHPGLPERLSADTTYVAVSASLQWGPWGPGGYFRALDGVEPVALTADTTIAVYESKNGQAR